MSPFHDYCARTEPPSVHCRRRGREVQHLLNLCISAQRVAYRLQHLKIVLEMRLVPVTPRAEE